MLDSDTVLQPKLVSACEISQEAEKLPEFSPQRGAFVVQFFSLKSNTNDKSIFLSVP